MFCNSSQKSNANLLKVVYIRACMFHQFRQAKFAYGGLILSSSHFLPPIQQPLKTTLSIKWSKLT
jgi:hypothetical protein